MFEIWQLGFTGLLVGMLVSWVMTADHTPDWMTVVNPLLALLLATCFSLFVTGESLYNSETTWKFGYIFTIAAPMGALWHTMRVRR